MCAGHPSAERASLGGARVDNCDQLEVGVPDWHDPVRCTPIRMVATLDRPEAVASPIARLAVARSGVASRT
jgi:hypothetical protein